MSKIIASLGLAFLLLSPRAVAAESAIPVSSLDKILVIAPHPDDETLGAGGVIQQAIAQGATLRIVYLTSGELNEIASIFYQKRPLLTKSDFIKKGNIRKQEAVNAMTFMGLDPKNLVFLGYPDGGTLNIWIKYWGNVKPFRSFFTRINKVPYKDQFSYGQYYKGEEIVRDLERLLLDFEPTQIYVTAPFDLNTDHQAAYLYLNVALLNIVDQLKSAPQVHLYIVHAHQWPNPKKYMPDEKMSVPTHIDWSQDVRWRSVELDAPQVEKKKDTILKYKSQIAYKKNFLLSFARKSEVFSQYEHEEIETKPAGTSEKDIFGDVLKEGDVNYKIMGDELWVQVALASAVDEMGALSSYIFAYRKGFLFSELPKFAFKLFGSKMFVYRDGKSFHDPSLVYRFDNGRLLLRVPLKLLKDPDHLFVSTRHAKEEMTLDFGSWKILKLEKTT